MKARTFLWISTVLLVCTLSTTARADVITDWTQIMLRAATTAAPPTSPLVMSRVGAIVQASVFEAVNGIERRYTSLLRVPPNAPPGASKRAAAVQAAYASLVRLYPAQIATFDQKRADSLAAISSGPGAEHSVSIARGIAWGQTVADQIWSWRSGDGFLDVIPPFLGGNAVGQWRPTPPAYAPGVGVAFSDMTPWVMDSPAQFQPAGPPPLSSVRYASDFNETKSKGLASSTTRTADETLASRFWAASTSTYSFNTIAIALSAERHLPLSENSRLLALMNIALADAAIGCWEAKYTYDFWRPVTAIPLAATDGNNETEAQVDWTPLLATPAHPEYPSGHSCVSGAAAHVLSNYFGENTSFSVDSDVLLGVTRNFTSFAAALEEIKDARIFAGIHFRSATEDGQTLGIGAANYAISNAFRRLHGDDGEGTE
jgi:PAP2 superfamily